MQERPNIEHVMTFIRVVELESFSAAADALGLSKSVVSKHVTQLEECLHAQLIQRSTRKLILTDEGKTFYNSAKLIPDQLAAAQSAIAPFQVQPHGILKVMAPMNFSVSLKKSAVPNFLAKYPDVTLQIQFNGIENQPGSDNYDVIIMWKLSHETFPDYNLIAKKLLRLPVGIYATPIYLEKHGVPNTPEDLVNHNCLAIANRPWPLRTTEGETHYVHVQGTLQTTDDVIIHGAVCNHIGITYSHRYIFTEELKQGLVVPILEDYTQLHLEIYAFYQPSPFLPRKISCFLDTLDEYYKAVQKEFA